MSRAVVLSTQKFELKKWTPEPMQLGKNCAITGSTTGDALLVHPVWFAASTGGCWLICSGGLCLANRAGPPAARLPPGGPPICAGSRGVYTGDMASSNTSNGGVSPPETRQDAPEPTAGKDEAPAVVQQWAVGDGCGSRPAPEGPSRKDRKLCDHRGIVGKTAAPIKVPSGSRLEESLTSSDRCPICGLPLIAGPVQCPYCASREVRELGARVK